MKTIGYVLTGALATVAAAVAWDALLRSPVANLAKGDTVYVRTFWAGGFPVQLPEGSLAVIEVTQAGAVTEGVVRGIEPLPLPLSIDITGPVTFFRTDVVKMRVKGSDKLLQA